MAHDIFISFAIEDLRTAEVICKALEDDGISCWYAPRDVPFGMDYEEVIVDAIYDSRLVILILSSHSNNSPHVRREIQNACAEEVALPILPVRVENVQLHKALKYYLSSAQWLDASTPPLESHLRRLVEQLRARLPRPSVIVEQATAGRDAEMPESIGLGLGGVKEAGRQKGKEIDKEGARPAGEPRERGLENETSEAKGKSIATEEKAGRLAALVRYVRTTSAMKGALLLVLGLLAFSTIVTRTSKEQGVFISGRVSFTKSEDQPSVDVDMANVDVYLIDSSNNIIEREKTDAQGEYIFHTFRKDLEVVVPPPAGYEVASRLEINTSERVKKRIVRLKLKPISVSNSNVPQ
jgi:hypothetical protein